ncbi:TPR domain protein [Pseudoalteromonas luteoviolacea B = ATCC 29581]|nr:TPR domain protein [Pseudoalteromonas luteoviolacea B = ATCC 29581]
MGIRHIFGFLALINCLQANSKTSEPLDEVLSQAESYLVVSPTRTLETLNSIKHFETLSLSHKMQWHLLALKAYVPTYQLNKMPTSLDFLFKNQESDFFKKQTVSILSASGIWLRRSGLLDESKAALECAVKLTDEPKKQLTLKNSLALVARQLNEYEKARALYKEMLDELKDTDNHNLIAIVHNNLGSIDLETSNIENAEHHFRLSLVHYQQIDKRSGIISSSLNLLFTFIIEGITLNFERLIEPTKNMTNAFPSDAKKALLFWLEARYDQLKGKLMTPALEYQLLLAFDQLEDDKMRELVAMHLAKPLRVKVSQPKNTPTISLSITWIDDVRQCKWLNL